MKIIISNSDNRPIYEQIVAQIKGLIIAGEIMEGEALPSMRLLAKELRISVITTKRAYDELEKEGFIFSITGKGSFVKQQNTELIKEQYLKEIEEKIKEIIQISLISGISHEEIFQMFDLLYENE
ncbi:MAG: GntR family transcriptional regulator [Eubacteriales bacterium]|nr:GntR family transcriptional regulator [Eubacteriales bacterium]MDD4390019.1 GntR family transcriptional regulator [Eubacteriales bacterium]